MGGEAEGAWGVRTSGEAKLFLPHLVSCSANAVYTCPISRIRARFTMLPEMLAMLPA